MTRDDWAWKYFSLGWSPLALCDPHHKLVGEPHRSYCSSPGKVPVGRWKHLQRARRSAEDLRRELELWPGTNLGVVLGAASGLAAVDVDSPAGYEWLETCLGRVPDAPRFTTARGLRLVFALPADGAPSRLLTPGVELLAAGRHTVVPPSTHPSGHAYAWLGDRELSSPPELPGRLLEVDEHRVECAGGGGRLTHMRNVTLFRLACALRRHGAEQEEIAQCLRVFNRRYSPPLRNRDLEVIARSAARYRPQPSTPPAGGGP